jgi:sec-independent protein translocase protein TatB
MFDFSVSEIGLIGVVALVAIGPERLPKVARAAGILLGRFRRYASSVKSEIDEEIRKSELKDLQQRMNETAREAQRLATASVNETNAVLNSPVAPAEIMTVPTASSMLINDASATPVMQPNEPPRAPLVAGIGGDPFSVSRPSPKRSKAMDNPQISLSLDEPTTPGAS